MTISFHRAMLALFSALLLCTVASAQTAGTDPTNAAPPDSTASASPVQAPQGQAHSDNFVIGADDVLAINVWKEAEISRSVPVRSDGKISLPLVGEIVAAGRTPLQLEEDITTRLRNYITAPEVTVIVQQINSQKYNILGQVNRPGSYSLITATTVMDAIANAGGFRDFAKKKGVYILRKDANGIETRLSFNYSDYVKGKNTGQNVALEPHDTVIVP